MLYLHDKNNLLVSVVPRNLTGGDEFLTYISIRAKFTMTGRELLDSALEAWNIIGDEQDYHLVAMREDGEKVVPLEQNIKDIGIHNGSPLQIVKS